MNNDDDDKRLPFCEKSEQGYRRLHGARYGPVKTGRHLEDTGVLRSKLWETGPPDAFEVYVDTVLTTDWTVDLP